MPTLEERVTLLEAQIRGLLNGGEADATPWWDGIRGSFRDDPHYDEAMRLGREWRDPRRANAGRGAVRSTWTD